VRGTESAALHVLRGVEEEAGKRRSAEVIVHVATAIALYILNHKRERLSEVERRYGMRVIIAADDALISPRFRIERLRTLAPGEEPRFVTRMRHAPSRFRRAPSSRNRSRRMTTMTVPRRRQTTLMTPPSPPMARTLKRAASRPRSPSPSPPSAWWT